jgi:hypothetical protein
MLPSCDENGSNQTIAKGSMSILCPYSMVIKQHINFSIIVFCHSLFGLGAQMNLVGAGMPQIRAAIFFSQRSKAEIISIQK